jgi:hypothetical protein
LSFNHLPSKREVVRAAFGGGSGHVKQLVTVIEIGISNHRSKFAAQLAHDRIALPTDKSSVTMGRVSRSSGANGLEMFEVVIEQKKDFMVASKVKTISKLPHKSVGAEMFEASDNRISLGGWEMDVGVGDRGVRSVSRVRDRD